MKSNQSSQNKEIVKKNNVLDQNQKKIFHTSSNFKVMKTRTLNNFVIIDSLKKINKATLQFLYETIKLFKHLEKIKKGVSINDAVKVDTDLDIDKSDKLHKFFNDFNLPLKSQEELCLFEVQLINNKDFKNEMIVKMAHLVQNNICGTVRAMVKFLFSDKLLQDYTFKGQKNKKSFSSLYSCSLIFDAIKRIWKFKYVDIVDVEIPLKTFIAGAKFRK